MEGEFSDKNQGRKKGRGASARHDAIGYRQLELKHSQSRPAGFDTLTAG
jgi:hypothetical protein